MSAFAPSPSYRTMDVNEFIVSALDQPMSLGSTLWDQATGGVLDSFGLGTGVREAMTPDTLAVPPEGTTTQEQFEQAARRTGRPVGAAIGEMFALQGNEAKALSEDEWKASENYRDAIPYDRGMTTERAAALAEMHDIKRVREFYAAKRPITAFVGNFAGQALDPINYLPVFGPAARAAAVAKAGRIGGTALTASAEAAISTAVAGVATAPMRARFGDDVSYEAMVNEVAMAALIGGAFGTVAGALGRRADARDAGLRLEAQARLETLKRVQEARATLNDAVQSLAIDGEVNISDASRGEIQDTAAELQFRQGAAANSGRVRDQSGRELSVKAGAIPARGLAPAEVSSNGGIYIGDPGGQHISISMQHPVSERGQWAMTGFVTPDGKFLTRTEALAWVKKNEKPDFRASENMGSELDALDYRERVPVDARKTGAELALPAQSVRSAVRLPDGSVKIGEVGQTHTDIITSLPDELADALNEADIAYADARTGQFLTEAQAIAQLSLGQQAPPRLASNQLVAMQQAANPFGNEGSHEAAAVATRVGKPEDMKALAAQYGVNPETGDFDELADVARLEAEGRLTEAEIAEIREADAVLTRGTSYGEALKAAVSCLL